MVRSANTFRGEGLVSSACSTFETVIVSAPTRMLLGDRSRMFLSQHPQISPGTGTDLYVYPRLVQEIQARDNHEQKFL